MSSPRPLRELPVALLATVRSRRVERLFFIGFAVAATCTVFAGFARTFYLRPYTGAAPLPPLVFVHGLVFTSWILLLLSQTMLVATGRTNVHRRLGVVGGLLAGVMIVVGWIIAIASARRGYIPSADAGVADPIAGLVVPLRDLFLFSVFVAAGLCYRRNSETHKRLLMLATINLLPAALGRIPLRPNVPRGALVVPLLLAFVLAGPVYDRITRGSVHWTYLWGGWLTALSSFAQFPVARTEVWHRFASWLIR